MKRFLKYLTGGRPMVETGRLPNDKGTGKPVYAYIDQFGRKWSAYRGFTWKRIKRTRQKGKGYRSIL